MKPVARHRRGFTLVELLVVVAIITVLVALIFPAVQAARESARRTQCVNNLRQIGSAILGYESSQRRLPAGFSTFQGSPGPCWGWGTFILPWLEQAALYAELKPDERRLNVLYQASPTAADKALLQTPLSLYRCPSDNAPTLNTIMRFNDSNFFPVATSNYVASAGNDQPNTTRLPQSSYNGGSPRYCAGYFDTDPGGAFFGVWDRRSSVPGTGPDGLALDQVLDGHSNTLALGERDGWHYAAVWVGVGDDSWFEPHQSARVLGRASFLLNWDYLAEKAPGNHGKGFGSRHPAGALFVFLDGAVRFFDDTMPNTIQLQLSNRRDNVDRKVVIPRY